MTTDDARSARLQALLSDTAEDTSVDRLLEGGVAQLAMSGAGVSVVTGAGDRGIVHATDRVSTTIEELQVSLGEGPCVDVWLGRLPVFEPDLGSLPGGRWPGFGPAARAAGAAAVFSVPLQVGRTHLGALDVYRDTVGGLSDADVHDALRLSDAVTQVLLRSQRDVSGPVDAIGAVGDGSPSDVGVEVYQASGMVMVQLDVDVTEALARLRAHAYADGRPLREVARDVVDRRLRLERDR